MSHLDELDEFEAEAELRLKKEYSAVFGLFRYCVLTQDATYLCNKLDLQYVPQPSYPFFHVRMEDVWVWDKNRPTRMIPRAEVYTSSDVTIEELRGEGDEPVLTAEALAKRIGEALAPTTIELSLRGLAPCVLLAIDVGNTQTVFGLFDGERLTEQFRVGTDRSHTGDELARDAARVRRPRCARRDRPLLVVPQLVPSTRRSPTAGPASSCSSLGPGRADRGPDPLRRPARGRPRPDRERGRRPRAPRGAGVVVDFGTSTNFDVVSAAGEFAGGVLAPGIEVSMDALFARAARLPKVPFAAPPSG